MHGEIRKSIERRDEEWVKKKSPPSEQDLLREKYEGKRRGKVSFHEKLTGILAAGGGRESGKIEGTTG